MYRHRLVLSLSLLLAIIIGQSLATFWAFGAVVTNLERTRLAQQMLTDIVHFRADAKRLKVWLAEYIIADKRDIERRNQLFERMFEQLDRLDHGSRAVGDLQLDHLARDLALQPEQHVAFLRTNLESLQHALQTREINRLENDAERWQTLMTLFDKFEGTDLSELVAKSVEVQKARAEQAEQAARTTLTQAYWLLGGMAAGGVILFCLLSMSLTRHFNTPLGRLLEGTDRLARGDFSHKIPETGPGEFANLARSFNLMSGNLQAADLRQRQLQDATEDRVQERTAQLQQVVNQLHDAEARQQRFLVDVSHELRTPTTIVMGEAELALRDGAVSAAHAQSFRKIVECCSVLTSRIDDLLMLSKGRHALVAVNLTVRPVDAVHADLERQIRTQAGHHGVELITDSMTCLTRSHETGLRLLVDCEKLQLVFRIITENALQYRNGTDVIWLSCEIDQDEFRVTLRDCGIGLRAEEISALFDRHFRGAEAARIRPDGLGIGLSIARTLVEAHDGTISIEHNRPSGAAVIVRLPLFDLENEA